MTDTTFTYDGTSSTSIPELLVLRVRRPLVGNRRDDFVEVPGREGFWLFAEKAGARTLTIEFDLLADSFAERRAAVIALADLLDSAAGMSKLIFSDEPDRFHSVRLASAPDPDEWLLHSAFSVDFIAEPYAYAVTPSSEAWTATSGVARTFTPPDKVYGIPELELTANGGTVTSLVVLVNGSTLTYAVGSTGLIAAGKLTISTLGFVVVQGASTDTNLDGSFSPAALDMAFVSGDFGYVVPGLNSITITRTGTAATVGAVLRWRKRTR